jgi:undecaprenyl-diphosphatase
MQDLLINIILGILQGLTEYLPVSSSGHIELGKALFGYKPNDSLTLSVILHFATVLSTVIVMRADIFRIFAGLFSFKWNAEAKFAFNVIISMIPAALAGFLFEKQLETFFEGNILLVGFMLYITGLLLFLANKAKPSEKTIKPQNAFIIGIAQAIALLPGISRSGATISSSVLLSIDKEEAAKFSFLMVIPLILGKVAKDILDGDSLKLSGPDAIPMLAGFIAALIVGIFACKWMLNLVKKGKLVYFSIYCFIVGTIAIIASVAAG